MPIRTIRFKRGTAAQWTASNDILDDGEPGFERDTGKFKIGDGVSTWNMLPYFEFVIPSDPEIPDDPGGGGSGSMLDAFENLNWVADRIAYSTSEDELALATLTPQARLLLAGLTPAAQQGVLQTYSMDQVNSLFAGAVPMAEMGYDELISDYNTSNNTPPTSGNGLTPLSVSITGENRHVWVEFRGLVSTSINSTVRAWLLADGVYDTSLGVGAVTAALTYPTYPAEISIKRRIFVAGGQNITFTIGLEGKTGSPSITLLGSLPNGGATLAVWRA